jgi:NAD(P)-dependent dehydrogenase (short-subunit alcohol dehydrogenase family)
MVKPIYPTGSYDGQTVVVTGSNVGLGKEAARHFTRLGASSVILGVRNLEKGNAAKEDIEGTTQRKDVVQVWEVDMASYSSVTKFAKRLEGVKRLDIALLNAGKATNTWSTAEDNESTITVNVVSTFLLALLLVPKLRETAAKFKTRPNLCIVSSVVHFYTQFPQKSAPEGQIFETLNDEKKSDIVDRYNVSKLLEVFFVRALAERYPATKFPITVNYVNPGLCHSELAREAGYFLAVLKLLLARSTEVGSRTLVHAASQGSVSHGQYMSDCEITLPAPLVNSEAGREAQERVWDELSKKLEAIHPGIMKNLDG